MADKAKFGESLPPGDADADPFVELTRIMGFDPREPVQPKPVREAAAQIPESAAVVQAVAADIEVADAYAVSADDLVGDFDIDLEREMLASFEDSEPLAVAQPVADATPAQAAEADAAVQIESPAEVLIDDVDLGDDEFDAVFAEDVGALEASFSAKEVVPELQTSAEFDADVDALNAAFAGLDEFGDELAPSALEATDLVDDMAADIQAVEIEAPSLAAPVEDLPLEFADEDDVVLDEIDFDLGDIDEAIGREMDQVLAADQDDMATDMDGAADVDLDFAIEEASFASRPATTHAFEAKAGGTGPKREDLDDLIAALDAVNNRPAKQPVTGGSIESATASTQVTSSALANMTNPYQTRDINSWRQPEPARQSREFAPEVETTEMFDQAYSMADDLDLPEVGYDEPRRASDDMDLEFDSLLNEISRGAPAPRPTQQAPHYDDRAPAATTTAYDDYGFDSVFAQPNHAASPRQNAYQTQPAQQAPEFDDFRFDEQDFDDHEPAQPAYRPRNGGGRGGRGMMIAMLVGGVAMLGGLGAFAMSWSGGSGTPALVKADTSPVKVRPENPGGSTVPNQNSPVYDTVSRSGGATNPGQERLVSSTEAPIDIPLPNDLDSDELADLSKGEDRIEPTTASADAGQDPLAVAPRKVRTMIVKPDGSLVPAELPEAAAASEPSVEEIAAAPAGEPEQITTGATRVSPAETASVAAAVPGGWTVQIASQPSEDGANKSLKTMGKRFAGAIGDRGLHVVKAEVEGKGTYWRVRVAAASRDDAINVCSNMKSAGGSCFVTR